MKEENQNGKGRQMAEEQIDFRTLLFKYIILLHDYNKIRNPKSQTIEALDKIIPDLLEKGYKFVTISELIEHLEKNTNNENNIK